MCSTQSISVLQRPTCSCNDVILQSCYLIIFACSAGIQIAIDQDIVALPESDGCQVMAESDRLSYVFSLASQASGSTSCDAIDSIMQVKAQMGLPATSTAAAAAPRQLPLHLAPQPKQAFEDIIDKQVYYRDPKSGKTKECTVVDHITSYLRGTYYLIIDSEGREEEVNEREMREMLESSGQQSPAGMEVSDSDVDTK